MCEYWMDLSAISLERYWGMLAQRELMPGRRALRQNMADHLRILQGRGVTDLSVLREHLRTKPRLKAFALASGLAEEWLVLLWREVQALTPKPVPVDRFPEVSRHVADTLAGAGIKDSRHLFERGGNGKGVPELAARLKLDEDRLADVAAMSDLVRVYGVGPVFARLFLDAGVASARAMAGSDPGPLFGALRERNEETRRTTVPFSERDVAMCIDMAKMLPGNA